MLRKSGKSTFIEENWVLGEQNSHMMAMRELKLPMLKHSRATSMKNSMTRALCFFFTGCRTGMKMHHSAGKSGF